MLVNHQNLGLLFTGFRRNFDRGVESVTPMAKMLATEIPSNTEKEEFDWLGQALGMREWLDDRVIESLGSHQYQIVNRDWEQTIGVERNKIEDDRVGVYSPMFQRMGEASALHPDELLIGLLNDGAAATSLGYDGVPFFSSAHPPLRDPVPAGHPGNQANIDSGGGGPYWYLLDLSSALKPLIFQNRKNPMFVAQNSLTDDEVFHRKRFLFGVDARYNVGYGFWQQAFASNKTLNETNVENAITAMDNLYGDNGKPLKFSPTHIVVPTTLRFAAQKIFSPDFVPSGTDGATITNIHRGTLQVIVSKHLART